MTDTSESTLQEAKRQLDNVRQTYDETKAERDEYLAIAQRQQAHGRMLNILRSASLKLLTCGQGQYVLSGDAKSAQETFAELSGWMPFFTGARGSAAEPAQLEFHLALEPAICLILGNDWASLAQLIAAADDPAVARAATSGPDDVRSRFLVDLLQLVRLDREPDARVGDHPVPKNLTFTGYEKLARTIVLKDSVAFESRRAELEAAYAGRKKRSEPAVTWYGYGKLSQAVTFDALGTALCRVAVRHNLAIDVDTRFYPRKFMLV
jgi:hypothetical protein